jgi:3-methyladenine DNA glycosylase AlkD
MVQDIRNELLKFGSPDQIARKMKYFHCYPGGYGDGDTFACIINPVVHKFAKTHKDIPLNEVVHLLSDPVHELRLLALIILDHKYNSKKAVPTDKEQIVQIYLSNLKYVNNWDLIDSSAHKILGKWAFNSNPDVLFKLAESQNLWENRVAMMSTLYHIRELQFEVPFKIARILLHHKHDLIHKVVGWMLREIGNRDLNAELDFLRMHYKSMPRTMLRYAIEKFDEPMRLKILKGQW